MEIKLSQRDMENMPEPVKTWFFSWLPEYIQPKSQKDYQVTVPTKSTPRQLNLNLERKPEKKVNRPHTRLSDLYDCGITKADMPVRIKLTKVQSKKLGRDYINNLVISPQGTIFFEGLEFNIASSLATKVNCTFLNGWQYIQVKKDGIWVSIDELRRNLT